MKKYKDLDIKRNGKPCIYKLQNILNRKVYIGFASGHYRRKAQHYWMLRNNRHFNSHLQASWNIYGEENFNFEVLRFLDEEDLLDRETIESSFISQYNALDNNFGYNTRENCETNLGIKWSDESKKRFSESKKGIKPPHLDYEKIAKKNMKAVVATNSNERLNFDSIKEASLVLEIDRTNISKALHGAIKTAGGYSWDFVEQSTSNNSVNCLETPEEGNQQPSLTSDSLEGSTTRSESQADNNSPKSAGQPIFPYKISDTFYALNMKALEEFDKALKKKVDDIV